jgi:hypothetical protein
MAQTEEQRYTTREKSVVDLALEHAWRKKGKVRESIQVGGPTRLARLHRKKFVASLQGEGIPGFQYLLARIVRANLTNVRMPFLDMHCKAWELWVYPSGRVTIKFERPLGGLPKPLHLEYDLGHAATS